MARQDLDRKDLERLYQRGTLSRAQFVAGLLGLGLTASTIELLIGAEPAAAAAPPTTAQYLVLIVLDAFRADYLDLQPMPALQSLVQSGVLYERAWVGQLESETPTSHATISTGAVPSHTGVLGFDWRDPATKKMVHDGWGPETMTGDLERDLKSSGTDSIPQAIKAANPASKVVAISSEKVYAASAMAGFAADYVLFCHKSAADRHLLVPAALQNHAPADDFLNNPALQQKLPLPSFTTWDSLSAALAISSLSSFRPTALMVNLPGADVYGHPYGGPATPAVMKAVIAGIDACIADIVQAYKSAGIYDQTAFVVVGDHGMVPNNRGVDGGAIKSATVAAGGEFITHWGGTGADIFIRNSWRARAVAEALAKLPGVASAYYQVDHQGQHHYLLAPGVKIDPSLDAANQYLLSSFAGTRAPDVVTPFRENTIGAVWPSAHGEHGGLNWGAQHVPLVISGPGVPRGKVSQYPAQLRDLAPTVLRLLGLTPQGMDGVVLADALSSPTAAETTAHAALLPVLTNYQNALIIQSADNLAEDAKLGLHPPPSLPARP